MSNQVIYVICPYCNDLVPISDDCVGQDRSDFSNVANCYDCDADFDYVDEHVKSMSVREWLLLPGTDESSTQQKE